MTDVPNPLGLNENERDRALEIHEKSIVIDASNVAIVDPWLEKPIADLFFDKMITGGVTASNVTVPRSVSQGIDQSLHELNMHRVWMNRSPEKCIHALTASDVEKAKKESKAAIVFGPQSANMIENRIEILKTVYDLGVRVMQLTYNARNFLGDGCMEKANAGLSDFGVEVVENMNRIGIVVDLSHCGYDTTMEAIDVSDQPSIFSHANPRILCNHPRNKADEQIQALAEKGGVMCVTPYTPFLRLREDAILPTFQDFLEHVEYVVDLIGAEHVGIGTDINDNNETRRIDYRENNPEVVGDPEFHNYPIGFDGTLAKYPVLTMALVSGGYSDGEIENILGANLMRVFRQVWRE